MIKLNNKNITYVALADSNNSLKAPKEIWYADSSNSVKLVYRRKDALIEGVDYEKYHWLVGDADAYINTLKYFRPYDDSVQMTFRDNLYPNRVSKTNKYNVEEQIWGACGHNYVQSIIRSYIAGTQQQRIANNIINATTTGGDVNWAAYNVQSDINENQEHSLYISSVNDEDEYYFIYNGNTKDKLPTRYTLPELVQQDVRIFRSGLLNNDYFNGSLFNFIHYRNNVEITHLIPCKLLKPVPKWLDANGIRRQVGECGMIDLVSGKFYGNVNSVGTFTVENYYERKNYLKCSDGSYMLYQNFDATSNIVNGNWVKFGTTEYLGEEYFLYGLIRTGWLCACYISENKLLLCNHIVGESYTALWKYDLSTLNSHDNVAIQLKTEQVSSPTKYVSRSSIVFSDNYTLAPQNDNWFYNTVWGNTVCNLKISTPNGYILSDCNITQNNNNVISSLIPCTLTMDLPASMDANNIARTKGTSGMWDLVSDKFYGNVASSGTFKAVNLAEGVDYEVHQWLVAEIYPLTFMMSIPINSSTFSYKKVNGNIRANLPHFVTSSYSYYTDNVDMNALSIWDNTNGAWVSSQIVGSPMEFNSTEQGLSVNNINITQYGFPVNYIPFSTAYGSNNIVTTKTSSITVDGIERYIPVKLLKSIPSKYDANGIARQAGECGMYDTVNDKFYGNVASSGTFSVSDDS